MDDQPAGLGWMPDGSMLVVAMERQEVLRRWPDGKVTLHAALPPTGFRSNDMVVDAAGRAYVGKFGFDLHGEMMTRGVESVVADHPTARRTNLEVIFRMLGEEFRRVRVALNDLTGTLLHLHETPSILIRPA